MPSKTLDKEARETLPSGLLYKACHEDINTRIDKICKLLELKILFFFFFGKKKNLNSLVWQASYKDIFLLFMITHGIASF